MKKKHPEHVNLERWLISYADFITLLFAFFVVMYAIANQDKAKIKQIVESIERSFTGASGKMDLGTGKTVSTFSTPSAQKGHIVAKQMGYTNAQPESVPELKEIAERIEDSLEYQLQTTDMKEFLELVFDERGLVIRLSANAIYKEGQTNVDLKYLPIFNKIFEAIIPSKRLIRIEGHTDKNPTEGRVSEQFETNWELSAVRAAWLVRYMSAKYKIPARRVSAAGWADGRPVADNSTAAGRAKNRRIEIVVTNVKDTSE